MSTRKDLLTQIDMVIDSHCKNCKTKADLVKIDDRNYSKTNAYCIKTCEIGLEIQKIGQQLLLNK